LTELITESIGLSNYLVNAGSVGYIDNTVYIGYVDPATSNTYIHGLSDTAYNLINRIAVSTGHGSTDIPNVMRAWHYNSHSYLGAISGGNTTQTLYVWDVTSLGSTLVFSDNTVLQGLPNVNISGEGPYFFPDPSGNIWVIYAYHPVSAIYTPGGAGHTAPTHWRVVKYTSTGTKTYTDFAADADGNCGTGGFFDVTSGKIVVSCNKGAYKIFDPGSSTVTLTYGSATSPTYTSTQEYTGVQFGSEGDGLYFAGTQGFPEVQLGSTFSLSGGHYFYGVNTSDTNTNQLIDIRDSSTLVIVNTVDINTLISGYAPSGINQYPGWTYAPTKNWLFVTDANNNDAIYVLYLATTSSSDSATGTGTFSTTTTGPVFRFLGVPNDIYTATLTYQKKPQIFGPFPITSCTTASAGHTTYLGTFDPLSLPAGATAQITGFTTTANNGSFTIVSCSTTTLVVANGAGAAETATAYVSNFDWAPIPDWFIDIYNNLFLSEMLANNDDERSRVYRQRGIAAFIAKDQGFSDTQKNAFIQQWSERQSEMLVTMQRTTDGDKAKQA
jgi:hypothetical protein